MQNIWSICKSHVDLSRKTSQKQVVPARYFYTQRHLDAGTTLVLIVLALLVDLLSMQRRAATSAGNSHLCTRQAFQLHKLHFAQSCTHTQGGLVTCCNHKQFALPLAELRFVNAPVPYG